MCLKFDAKSQKAALNLISPVALFEFLPLLLWLQDLI